MIEVSHYKEKSEEEPVLAVPPSLTKSAYAILISLECVARKWHLEGRYGSRTHQILEDKTDSMPSSTNNDTITRKMGLPLSMNPKTIDLIACLLKERNSTSDSGSKEAPLLSQVGDYDCPRLTNLRHLLYTPGVELIYETPTPPSRIPKPEHFDATIHQNSAPQNFPSRMLDFLASRRIKEDCGDTATRHHHNNNNNKQKNAATFPSSPPSPCFTFCELFAGIGGFGTALEALGGKCVFASEIYEPSKLIYCSNLDTRNLPDEKVSGDIWKIDSKDIPSHDLLVGGFPCQPFSRLGTQPGLQDDKASTGRRNEIDVSAGNGDEKVHCDNLHDYCNLEGGDGNGCGRGQLFTQIVRVLKDCQPKAFLLENVPGLVSTDNGNALRTIVSALEEAGYFVTYEVCSSRGLTAQSRKRLYIVGIRKCQESVEKKKIADASGVIEKDCNARTRVRQPQKVSESFQFPFIPDLGLRAGNVLHTKEELQTSFSETGVPIELFPREEINLQTSTPVSFFRISDSQMDQLRNRSKSWKPAKLAWHDTTCDTIDSHYGVTIGKGNSQLVPCSAPHHPRRFTPRECARIMGFSNSFRLGDYHTFTKRKIGLMEQNSTANRQSVFNSFIKEQYHMLGNAVCPPVIAALAGAILERCPGIAAWNECDDWVDRGLWVAIDLALEAVSPSQRASVNERLKKQFSSFDSKKYIDE